jgi:hypothetical protein
VSATPALSDAADDGPGLAEMTAFARRHGLGGLAPEHLARMRELAAPVARFGMQIRRPARKDEAPASEFRVTGATRA